MKKFKAEATFKNNLCSFAVKFEVSAENKKQALMLAKSAQATIGGNFAMRVFDATKVKLCE